MFKYNWNLKDGFPAPGIQKHDNKVLSLFSSGGGSTMGYKLAGYDVIGCLDIDDKLINDYKLNFDTKYVYNEDIRVFKERKDLPKEFYDIDLLDASPPCTTFSLAGLRERSWGVERTYAEGKVTQTLDDLYFQYLEVVDKLRPKVTISENVKGITQGKAKEYVINIMKLFDEIGYYVNMYLLDSSKMGLPQKRLRFFTVAVRKDLAKYIDPELKEDVKVDYSIFDDVSDHKKINLDNLPKYLPELVFTPWSKEVSVKEAYLGSIPKTKRQNYRPNRFGDIMVNLEKPLPTIATINRYWKDEQNLLSFNTLKNCGSWPQDYKWSKGENSTRVHYSIGMSVPPIMMAWVSNKVKEQYLDPIKMNMIED